ncbi:hypothetical protein CQR58_007460 [Streptomyces acidiscabies]|uniref:hypothetical protein n=1 Tax=Streptomyces acidiscabies TaxID=42234 RepID=UPI0034C693A5
MRPARSRAAARSSGSVAPGSSGSPLRDMSLRALTLLPSSAITSGGGPIRTTPADRQASAKSASSERKP